MLSKEIRKNENNTFKSNLYTLFLPTDRNIFIKGRSPQALGRSSQAPELNNNELKEKQQQEPSQKAPKAKEENTVVVSSASQKEKKKAYNGLLSIGLSEKAATKYVKENTPERIYSCIDYAQKIGNNVPATCVAALNEGWDTTVKKATQNPISENKVLEELRELEANTEDRWSGIEIIRQIKQALSNTNTNK